MNKNKTNLKVPGFIMWHILNNNNSVFNINTRGFSETGSKNEDNKDSTDSNKNKTVTLPAVVESKSSNDKTNETASTGDTNSKEIITSVDMAASTSGEESKKLDTSSTNSGSSSEAPSTDIPKVEVSTDIQTKVTDTKNQDSDKKNDRVEAEPLLVNLPEEFSLLQESTEMVGEADKIFEEYCRVKNMYIVAGTELKHLKSPQNAAGLAKSDEMFVKWSTCEDFYRLYLQAIKNAIKDVKPISLRHIKDLGLAFSSQKKNLPIFSMNPKGRHVSSSALYGLSVGANDLVHFTPSSYNAINLSYEYDATNLDGDLTTTTVKWGQLLPTQVIDEANLENEIKAAAHFRPFDAEAAAISAISNQLDAESIFVKHAYNEIVETLYTLNASIKVDYIVTGESQRSGITSRTAKGDINYGDAFKQNAVIMEDLTINVVDNAVLDQIAPLMIMFDVVENEKDRIELINYSMNIIYEYCLNTIIKYNNEVKIAKVVFTAKARRTKNNSDLKPTFDRFVRTGKIVLLSPLHYDFYLGSSSELSLWKKYIFYSSICNVKLNNLMSVMPSMTSRDKNELSLYAINRDRLHSTYYETTKLLPFQRTRHFSITFNDFINEMFVRTMMKSDIPSYIYIVSAGLWTGFVSNSISITPASLNPLICKFALTDVIGHIDTLFKAICINLESQKRPGYVKTLARLSQKLPDIYGRYLPDSDYSHVDIFEKSTDRIK